MTVVPTPPVTKSSLPDIFFTDALPRQEYPAIFVYAIAGAGKTNLFDTVKHLSPFVAATEDGQTKGMATLAHLHIAGTMIDNLDQLIAVVTELSANARPGQIFYRGHGPFGLLGVDSLTGVGPMLEDAAKKVKGWDMIWDAAPGGRKDPRSAYPYIAERGRQIVRKMMSLPVPLVMMAREQLVTEGEGSTARSYAAPELPGQKLPRELPGWPEATIRMRMINGQRVFVTENEGDVVARVRLREGLRLPKYCKPDLGALIRLLSGDASALKDLEPPRMETPKTPQQIAAEQRRAQTALPDIQQPKA